MDLRKFVIPEIIFGTGSLKLAGQYTRMTGGYRILLVTDRNLQECSWFENIIDSLESQGLSYHVYDEISPNPRDFQVMKGAAVYRNTDCDGILAVGGGSVIDAAKGIGIVANNGGDILDFEGIDKIENPIPPLICIPTTCGSSADVSQFAIINDTEGMRKIAIVSKALVPDLSLIDPETLLTLERDQFVAASLDTLSHAVEAYVSTASSVLTDRHSLGAISLLGANLVPALQDSVTPERLSSIMNASMEAGMAFSNASLGLVHAMSHVLGGYKDYPHGVCNGVLLKAVCRYNYGSCPERYDTIADVLAGSRGVPSSGGIESLMNELDILNECTGINESLNDFTLTGDECRLLAEMSLQDICNATNPRIPQLEEVNELYREVFNR